MSAGRIVCLLPVRNGGPGLSAWLDHAAAFCDAVVALDDGSTDGTGDVLAAHPLVDVLLRNPQRDSYLGWHDGVNRNRLLTAVGDIGAEWVISVDADERIDASDAARLRTFVATDALRGYAYGFQVYRMVDGTRYDPDFQWAFRLFAYRPDQRFPHRRVDFPPVPTSIAAGAWMGTTLRLQHFGDEDAVARQARVAKYREADPEGIFRSYYENLRPQATGPFPVWAPSEASKPVLITAARAAQPGSQPGPGKQARGAPFVVCLLPARNCEALLRGWFESVARFADGVVALDDGSTDRTAQVLRDHPLVQRLLCNPRRDGYAAWDDGANRNRLLAAAADLEPDWVVSLDADERIPLEDGVALRRFLADEARSEFAYGLPVHRMIGDEGSFDRRESTAWRIFAFDPGQRFTDTRLHGAAVPTSIPRHNWLPTTIRLQHLGGIDDQARQARFEKYRQADPGNEWEPDYEYTRTPQGDLFPWPTRPRDLPVVDWPVAEQLIDDVDVALLDLEGPVLTVAVLPGEVPSERVEGYVTTLRAQTAAEPFEVFIASDRSQAMAWARGDYLLIVETGTVVADGLFDRLIEAHERGSAVVFGAGVPSGDPVVEAARLLDLAWPAAREPTAEPLPGPPMSFARQAVARAGGFDERLPTGIAEMLAADVLADGFTAISLDQPWTDGAGRSSSSPLDLIRARGKTGRLLADKFDVDAVAAKRQAAIAATTDRRVRALIRLATVAEGAATRSATRRNRAAD